eukprot:CAMPEP_0177485440 /NCGR_PEP_ID=MMETSP0369-20130122/28555_1 /TAXON_ID=447022 ORGANISM="Scrippsiella hangoei-like, Strain SHHI-4" /NCGR_SAMPLE_ID=MMETSP0369 /ASSEMBLY_ACC=CAM_ASM_000364 /LENGTH=332 /DNA_ID=CAMNT_0018961605 /DNA_START=190 /DNA_END=1187 /DNA_ORIENTATION=+
MSLSFHNTSRPPRFERATAANCTRQSRNSAAAEKLMLAVRKAAAKLEAPEVEREAVVEELQPRVNPWELLRPAQDDAQSTGVEVRGGSSSSQHRPHSDDHHDGEDCDVSHDDEGVSAAPVVATRLPYVPPSAPVANADVGGAAPGHHDNEYVALPLRDGFRSTDSRRAYVRRSHRADEQHLPVDAGLLQVCDVAGLPVCPLLPLGRIAMLPLLPWEGARNSILRARAGRKGPALRLHALRSPMSSPPPPRAAGRRWGGARDETSVVLLGVTLRRKVGGEASPLAAVTVFVSERPRRRVDSEGAYRRELSCFFSRRCVSRVLVGEQALRQEHI